MKFFNKEISGNFATVSGILTTKPSIIELIAREVREIGVITGKSTGIKEWDIPSEDPTKGPSLEPIVCEIGIDCFRNNVGSRNPGYKKFKEEMEEMYERHKEDKLFDNKFILVSIFGKSKEEFAFLAKNLEHIADGFELNFSCPHAEPGYGSSIGAYPNITYEFTKAVRKATNKPLFAKLTPNVNNIGEIALAAIKAGANGISAINTVGPEVFYYNKFPILSNKKGGKSGRDIKDIGVKCIKEIRKLGNFPIIGMGGITTAADVKEYEKAGANIFGLGSVSAMMDINKFKRYCSELNKDLKNNTNNAEKLTLDKLVMQYKPYKIKEIKKLTDDLRIFYFNKNYSCLPGQFVFTWIPDVGEKPFSVADTSPLTLAVRKVGRFTSALFEKEVGDEIYIRGPYGKGVKPVDNAYIVAGGTGAATALLLAKKTKKPTIFLGATNKKEILFKDEFKKYGKLHICIDDGKPGKILEKIYNYLFDNNYKKEEKTVYNIGPTILMKKAMDIEKAFIPLKNIYCSLETETNCGIGLCGNCEIDGYRNCIEGTFFNAEFLLKTKLFK